MQTISISSLFILALVAACATESDAPDAPEVPDDIASTVLDPCAVGHAQNATSSVTPFQYDAYTRGASRINGSGPNECNCRAWQQIADPFGEDAANDSIPTCRPETSVEFTVSNAATFGAKFHATTQFGDKLETQAGCTDSNLHMEIWKYVSGTTWSRVWAGTGDGQWFHPLGLHECSRTVGDSAPVVGTGRYRVKATANVAGEQGFGDVTIYAGTPPAPQGPQ